MGIVLIFKVRLDLKVCYLFKSDLKGMCYILCLLLKFFLIIDFNLFLCKICVYILDMLRIICYYIKVFF